MFIFNRSLRNYFLFRKFSDASHRQRLIYNELKHVEENFKKLNLDSLKSSKDVDDLLAAGKINQNTAEYVKHSIKRRIEAAKSGDYWKKLFLFIGIPSIGLVAYNTYKLEEKHEKHLSEHPPEFIPYEHLKIRTKKFFWGDGDSALFQHPKFKQ